MLWKQIADFVDDWLRDVFEFFPACSVNMHHIILNIAYEDSS